MMEPTDAEHLRLFRDAARQVRSASIIDQGRSITIQSTLGSSTEAITKVELLDAERFRSLALAVRLVYQTGEPAHFGHVCNILARNGSVTVQDTAADLRRRYNDVLNGRDILFLTFAFGRQVPYSTREIFETWLYHGTFHQDPSRKADYEFLSAEGDKFEFVVQAIALQLAGRVLDLDDVVADVLGEPRVPRIGDVSVGGAR